jgi:2-polyprenyl-3-methyl-5-hydroxy-6-metoxy-1,4-benzoquinol methylase
VNPGAQPPDQAAPACALCGATGGTIRPLDSEFSLRHCAECAHVSTTPQLDPVRMAAYYPVSYYGRTNRRFNVLAERLIVWFRKRRADEIQRLIPEGRLLDIGCGRGLLPALMRERGWLVQGTELNRDAAVHASEVLNVPVWIGDFQDCPFADASFDVAVLWHVLEHLRDPLAALARCRRLLRPGGLLVIAVPNYESWQARLGGRSWFHLDIPRHYHHFRATVLVGTLIRCGFLPRKTSHFSLEQNPFGWLQTILNRMGLRHNLLYESLKNASARSEPHPSKRFPLQFLASLFLSPFLALAAGALALLECAARRGGTIEIYAVRDAEES